MTTPHYAYMCLPPTHAWHLFARPSHIYTTHSIADVMPILHEIQHRVDTHSCYAVGFLSYEAAPACDPAMMTYPPGDIPLLWFGIYTEPVPVTPPPCAHAHALPISSWSPPPSFAAYTKTIEHIHAHIAAGDVYQINHTYRLNAHYNGDAEPLWQFCAHERQARYGALIHTGRHIITSLSPELFFARTQCHILCRPMKGTAPRGMTLADDNARAHALASSEKERAENIMIVDMIRNDLGRIAHHGSVRVTDVCRPERYPTVWQMTSTIEAETHADVPDIFRALFPCASITGAPKIKAMEIIQATEPNSRGVYCGAIGMIAPEKRALFNVAIRTLVCDTHTHKAEYGVGGGIVWDSTPSNEYAECQQKAQILTTPVRHFDIFEALLWSPEDGLFLEELHTQRMRDSCVYFSFTCPPLSLGDICAPYIHDLPPVAHKIRIRIAHDGSYSVDKPEQLVPSSFNPVSVAWARTPVEINNPFLYHKTSCRDLYKNALADVPEADDVLFWNTHGHVTESSIANIVITRGGQRITPPVTDGLLPGVFREYLLRSGDITEQHITPDDVMAAEHVWLISSVRKWRVAHIRSTPSTDMPHSTS